MADIIYPFKKYNYKVTIDGTEAAGFSEVSAPDITVDPIEYREGNMAGKTPGKQPGILKYSNVTLKRGTTDSLLFMDWMTELKNGTVNRKTIVITLVDDEGIETEVYADTLAADSPRNTTVTIESTLTGSHVCRVYLDGSFAYQRTVTLE